MNKKKLLERQKFIKASVLPSRIQASIFSRRTNNINLISDNSDPKDSTSFFDFEDELSGLKPSAEQFAILESEDNSGPTFLEERDNYIQENLQNISEFEPTVIEEAEENSDIENYYIELEDNSEPTNEEPILSQAPISNPEMSTFIQCNFIKGDGQRCKRQAPKGKEICSAHSKLLGNT